MVEKSLLWREYVDLLALLSFYHPEGNPGRLNLNKTKPPQIKTCILKILGQKAELLGQGMAIPSQELVWTRKRELGIQKTPKKIAETEIQRQRMT